MAAKEKNHGLVIAIRIITAAFILGLIIYIAINIDKITVDNIVNLAPQNKLLAVLVFVLLYVMKSFSFVFPVMILQISAGLVFGPFWGILVNVLGSAACVTGPFFLADFIAPNARKRLVKKYPAVERMLDSYEGRGFFLPFFLRVLNFMPIDVVSCVLGLMKLEYFKYVSASVLGLLPGIIVATVLGDAVRDPSRPAFFISIAVAIVISGASAITFTLVARKKKRDMDNPDETGI